MSTGVIQAESNEPYFSNSDFQRLDELDVDVVLNEADQSETHLDEEKEEEKYINNTNNNNIAQINPNQLKQVIKPNSKPIGEGKFGSVYKGTYNNETVAIKQYKYKKDYLHEINVIKHINNSFVANKYNHILKPHGICNESFVSEFMSTGSGDKLLYCKTFSDKNIRNNLYILDILDILIDVCHGIKCLHSMGIIHRDLSARNLLFKPNNRQKNSKKFIVKLCDFGECEINKNKTDCRKGPYLWLSPESIRQKVCNIRTDIYSFGILCYELIIGTRPLPNTPVEVAVIEILCLSQRPNITLYYKFLPLPLFILIQMCWQQISAYRPNNFTEILNKLNELRLNHFNYINTRLDDIKFNKTKSKEMLKDLSCLVSQYLSSDHDCVDDFDEEFKEKTKHELLTKIFSYNFNQDADIKAINFYLDHFPWGEHKNDEQHSNAVKNVDQYTQQFDVKLKFVDQI